jgi:hypothetical protein
MDDPSAGNPVPPVKLTNFPHPELTNIPIPTLTYDFRMCVTINPRIDIGSGPFGERKWISFQGGSWSASFGSGTVMVSPFSSPPKICKPRIPSSFSFYNVF